jgi:serine/threonine protein kinase
MGNLFSFSFQKTTIIKKTSDFQKITFVKDGTYKYVIKKFQNKNYFENEVISYLLTQGYPTKFPKLISYNSSLNQIILPYYTMDLNEYNLIYYPSHKILFNILYQILEKIMLLHNLGIEHHDIKMENCVVDYHNQWFLIDYEMATFRYSNEKIKSGTRIYMPPESFYASLNSQFGKKDIWSFGILYCILIKGWVPILNNKKEEYVKLSNCKMLPKIIQKCFFLHPKDRITSLELYREFSK